MCSLNRSCTVRRLSAKVATSHRPRLQHFMHYDPYLNEKMASTANEVPATNVTPPTPAGNVTQDPLSPTTTTPTSRTERSMSATEVIDVVLAEDKRKEREAEMSATDGSRPTSRSRSRSRPTSAAGSRRNSTSVWDNDKEKKQRKMVEKIFGHRWVPDFLK